MPSKRLLKKNINNLTFDLVSECMVYKFYNTGKKGLNADDAMESLVAKRNELIEKVNHPADTSDFKKNRDYYRTIVAELKKMPEIMDKHLK